MENKTAAVEGRASIWAPDLTDLDGCAEQLEAGEEKFTYTVTQFRLPWKEKMSKGGRKQKKTDRGKCSGSSYAWRKVYKSARNFQAGDWDKNAAKVNTPREFLVDGHPKHDYQLWL